MISTMYLAALTTQLLTKNGAVCPGGTASIGAFIGLANPPAHVLRIDRVTPSDPSYQGYTIAYVAYGSDGVRYLMFPPYRRLAPDMTSMLAFLLGKHRFSAGDAASVVPLTKSQRARLDGPNFKELYCAGAPPKG